MPELIPVLRNQPAVDVSHKPGGRLPFFPPGLPLPSQSLRGLLPVLQLGEQRHNGTKTVARQRRDCDLNPGPFCARVQHYTDTDTDFFAAKLRWVRAGPFRRKKSPCPCSGI